MLTLDNVVISRLLIFLAVIALLGYFEYRYPCRLIKSKWRHVGGNFSLILLSTLLLKLLFQMVLPLSVAVLAAQQGWGVTNWLGFSSLAENGAMIIGWVVLLDCAIYWQHRLMHKVPVLWRLHRVHHADRDFDYSTGVRFHPIEMIISALFKSLLIALFGVPVTAVIIFEILLSTSSLFEHANFRLPSKIDRLLRKLIVTPNMHRIHHSVIMSETNSNFGFNLSWWDYLFGSYTDKPKEDEAIMPLGLQKYQNSDTSSISWMMTLPFRRY